MSHKLAQQKPESSLPVLPLETESPSRIASNKEVITTIEVLRELDRVVEDSAVLEFEAKRNTANQGKTLETFLALAKNDFKRPLLYYNEILGEKFTC